MHSESALAIPVDHPAFAGHFPGAPVVPGVLLLDAAIHALCERVGPAGATCRISAAKFLSPVAPGESLVISLDSTDGGSVRFEIASGGRKVATGTLVLPALP